MALARAAALGAVLRRHPHQPLSARVDRHARAAGAERVAVDQLRLRPARAGRWRVGLRRRQPGGTGRGPDGRRTGGGDRPRQRRAGDAQGGAGRRRQGRRHLDQQLQTRSVRGAARHQDRLPHEAQRGGAGRARRQLRQLAGAVRRRAEVLRLERGLAHHPAAGADLPAVHHHRRRPRQRRLPDPRRRRSGPAGRLRVRRGLPVAARRREGRPRGGREAEGQAGGAGPLRPGRRSVAAVPGHPRIGRPFDRARSLARLGSQHGRHQLPQGERRRQAALRRLDRQPGRRPHPAGRAGHHRLRRRRREGRALAPGPRRDVRRLADHARAGAAHRPAALARLPALGQLVERAVPADAERLAPAGRHRGDRSTISSPTSSAGCSSRAAAARRSTSSATTSSSAAP